MITDALIQLVNGILQGVLFLLPVHEVDLPDTTGIRQMIGQLDSVLPIAGVIQAAVAVLAVLAVFLVVRVSLLVWKALPLT